MCLSSKTSLTNTFFYFYYIPLIKNSLLWHRTKTSFLESQFVRGFQTPLFKAPTPFLSLPPTHLFKFFVFPPLFSVPPPFKVFQTVPPTLTQIPPAVICSTNISWFKQIAKGQIYQFNCCFLSKINFNLLNPFTNRLS